MVDYKARIKKFQQAMPCKTACLVSEEFNPNVFYFTGFKGFGVLIIPKKGDATFLTTKLDVCNVQNKNISIMILEKEIKDYLKKLLSKKLGLDFASLTLAYFKYIKKIVKPTKVTNLSKLLYKQREIKEDYEIKQIELACNATDEILHDCINKINLFKYEYEIKNFIDSEIRKRGYENSFDTIVASGKNAANPHYSSCKDKLKKGFLLIDFGIKANGYCSDMTRTIYLGTPSKKESAQYNDVLSVQEKAIDLLKTKKISEVDTYVKMMLGKKFIHSLGHGIGLEVHEMPSISHRNLDKLENGMCIAIEPAIYEEGKYGIRIEDDLVMLNNQLKVITKFPKKLIIVNKNIYK